MKKITKTEKLYQKLLAGRYLSNFELYKHIYGNSPCGRLGSLIDNLRKIHGYKIEGISDKEYLKKRNLHKKLSSNNQKYWYRLQR